MSFNIFYILFFFFNIFYILALSIVYGQWDRMLGTSVAYGHSTRDHIMELETSSS